MPEPSHESSPGGLRLPASDPAAPAVEALRGMVSRRRVVATAELAAFLEDPAGTAPGTSTNPRSDLVTVVRLPIRRAGRVAVAAGAALALAALGGAAVAATGAGEERVPANVQQDDPSGGTTTEATETEAATETEPATETEATAKTDEAADAPAHTANATASANHHDGVGADDEHADVNGGGEVDHRAEHSPTAHPTGPTDSDESGDDEGGEDAASSQNGAGSHRP